MADICVFSILQAQGDLLNMHYIIWSPYQPWVIRIIIIFATRNMSFRELKSKISCLEGADPGWLDSRTQALSLSVVLFLSPVPWGFMWWMLRQEKLQ